MDEDMTELVLRLIIKVGMVMEDASAIALLSQADPEALIETLECLENAMTTGSACIYAAKAIITHEHAR